MTVFRVVDFRDLDGRMGQLPSKTMRRPQLSSNCALAARNEAVTGSLNHLVTIEIWRFNGISTMKDGDSPGNIVGR